MSITTTALRLIFDLAVPTDETSNAYVRVADDVEVRRLEPGRYLLTRCEHHGTPDYRPLSATTYDGQLPLLDALVDLFEGQHITADDVSRIG